MAREPWDQLPEENDKWYQRFEQYRLMGPGRSLAGAYNLCRVLEPEITGMTPGVNWRDKMGQFKWIERARAWDEIERERFRTEVQQISDDKRLTRLQMISQLKDKTFTALMTARIEEMNMEQARAFFPQLRLLMIGLFASERMEFALMGEGVPEEATTSEEQAIAGLKHNIDRVWGVAEDAEEFIEYGAGTSG